MAPSAGLHRSRGTAGDVLHVEDSAVFAAAQRREPLAETLPDAEALLGAAPGRARVVDAAGAARGVYRPLLVYAWLQTFRLLYERLPRMEFSRWDEALRAWCDALEADLTGFRPGGATLPAAAAGAAGEAAWAALALQVAGKVFVRDAWTDLASDLFGRLARAQAEQGSFSTADASDSPELFWYHELVLLHASAGYAVQCEDRAVAAAVARATEFHLRETQPDHATTEPWAVFAFVWNPATRGLADQVLHAHRVASPAGAGGLSLILLADALYCLRLFGAGAAAD